MPQVQLLDGNFSAPKKTIPSTAIPSSAPQKETTTKIEKESLKGELAENSLSEIPVAEETPQLKRDKDNLIPKIQIQKQGNGSDIKEEMGSKNLENSLKLTIKVKNNGKYSAHLMFLFPLGSRRKSTIMSALTIKKNALILILALSLRLRIFQDMPKIPRLPSNFPVPKECSSFICLV